MKVSIFILIQVLLCATTPAFSRDSTPYDLKSRECLQIIKDEGIKSDEYKKCAEEARILREAQSDDRRRKKAEHVDHLKRQDEKRSVKEESRRVEFIKKIVESNQAYKKYETAALNKEIVVGMPQPLFDLASFTWNCERNTSENGDRYHTQHVCTGAFSKKGDLQGKYFYTSGKVIKYKNEKLFQGSVSAIQN